MLIGTIRDKKDKNNYYIELDEKSSKYQVICTNNSNTYLLNEIEVKTLIKKKTFKSFLKIMGLVVL